MFITRLPLALSCSEVTSLHSRQFCLTTVTLVSGGLHYFGLIVSFDCSDCYVQAAISKAENEAKVEVPKTVSVMAT